MHPYRTTTWSICWGVHPSAQRLVLPPLGVPAEEPWAATAQVLHARFGLWSLPMKPMRCFVVTWAAEGDVGYNCTASLSAPDKTQMPWSALSLHLFLNVERCEKVFRMNLPMWFGNSQLKILRLFFLASVDSRFLNLWSISCWFLLWSSSGLGRRITRKQAMNGRKPCGCPYLQNGKHKLSSVQRLLGCQKKNYKGLPSFSEVIYFWLCKSLLLSHNCIISEIILWPGACVAGPSVLSYWLWDDCHHFIQCLKMPKMKQLPYLLMRFTRKRTPPTKESKNNLGLGLSKPTF